MKGIFYLGSLLLLFLSSNVMAQEEKKSIKIKITDESGKVIEKEYESAEALENDPEIKALGVDVEAENGGIRMKSSGSQSVVIQQNSGKEGGNRMYIQQGPGSGSRPDSVGRASRSGAGSFDPDSLRREEHVRSRELRDSLLSQRNERREEMMREMEERRAEMRRRMDERRGGNRRDKQLIIIESLSRKEADQLGIRNEKLELEDLKILPDPDEETLTLSFSGNTKGPFQVKLMDSANRLLLDESLALSGNTFEETFELNNFREGTYFLQIIQDKKSLSRKISIQ